MMLYLLFVVTAILTGNLVWLYAAIVLYVVSMVVGAL